MFEAHIFSARKVPSERELHCLVAHLTDKQDVPLKVQRNGRVISVVAAAQAIAPRSIELETNAFAFKRTEAVAPFGATDGDIVTLSLSLCYVIKRAQFHGRKNATEVPFDAFGRIKPACREHFFAYLERVLGVTGLLDGTAVNEFHLEPRPMVQVDERKAKVWFTGACDITLRARVADAGVFNRLAGQAVGNRRSYGFGSVSCDLIESARDRVEEAVAEEA